MILEIRFSDEFLKAFKKLKKRYKSLPQDVNALIDDLKTNPEIGIPLRNGMRKIRIAFASKGRGKAGGGRVIIRLAVSDTQLSFLYIYDKEDMGNVADNFLDQIIIEMDEK